VFAIFAERKVFPAALANRLPTLLANPGKAFASWITIGTFSRFAAT
jgi:hypothetical protein